MGWGQSDFFSFLTVRSKLARVNAILMFWLGVKKLAQTILTVCHQKNDAKKFFANKFLPGIFPLNKKVYKLDRWGSLLFIFKSPTDDEGTYIVNLMR